MSKKGNIILFIIMLLICVSIVIFCLIYENPIQIEETQFEKIERLCEILDVNKQTVKYFVGDIDYTEKETYVQITKQNENCTDTIIILPAGTIRFFNVESEESYEKNTRNEK